MNEQEFIITDGTSYIKQNINNAYKLVKNISIADTWNSYRTAYAILNNSIPKSMSRKLYVATLESGNIVKCALSTEEKAERKNRIVSHEQNEYVLNYYSFDADKEVQQMIAGFEMVRDAFNNYSKKYREIEEALCTIDYAIEDIKHYHVKRRLNARDGYKLYDLNLNLILKRVSVKNQLAIVKKLNKYYDSTISQIEDICNTIDELRNRKYRPRVLIDLFEGDNITAEINKITEITQ